MARARTAAGALSRLLQETASPLYVLDHSRRIVYANAALFAWVGVDESQILGRRCDYHSGGEGSDAIAAALCPPPGAFTENRASFLVSLSHAAEKAGCRRAECLSLASGSAENAAFLIILADASRGDDAGLGNGGRPEIESQALHQKLADFRRQAGARYRLDRLVGESLAMQRARARAELATRGPSNVLIVGPRGSGREHLARGIHLAHAEAVAPLVPLACPLLDAETLQETVRQLKRKSAREAEHPGALLLLEVDQLPARAQDELAGFLNLPDFRLATLATARQSLEGLAAGAGFRLDLACRLGTLVIELPGLAERREDVPLLAQRLLEEHNSEGGAQLSGFTPEALDELFHYDWPGNVDELAQFVRESCERAAGPWVGTPELPPRIRLAADAAAVPPSREERIMLDDFLAEIERELIERALARAKGNRTKAAGLLGVTRPRLHRRLVQLGLAGPALGADEMPIPFEEVELEADNDE